MKDKRTELLTKKIEAGYEKKNQKLTLISKALQDRDIPLLIEFINKNPIQSLILMGNGITDKGADLLAQLSNLKTLNLARNKITDKGAEYLSKNPTIRHLDLFGNNLSKIGIMALEKNNLLLTCDVLNKNISEKRNNFFQRKIIKNNIEQLISIGVFLEVGMTDPNSFLSDLPKDILKLFFAILLLNSVVIKNNYEILNELILEMQDERTQEPGNTLLNINQY